VSRARKEGGPLMPAQEGGAALPSPAEEPTHPRALTRRPAPMLSRRSLLCARLSFLAPWLSRRAAASTDTSHSGREVREPSAQVVAIDRQTGIKIRIVSEWNAAGGLGEA